MKLYFPKVFWKFFEKIPKLYFLKIFRKFSEIFQNSTSSHISKEWRERRISASINWKASITIITNGKFWKFQKDSESKNSENNFETFRKIPIPKFPRFSKFQNRNGKMKFRNFGIGIGIFFSVPKISKFFPKWWFPICSGRNTPLAVNF